MYSILLYVCTVHTVIHTVHYIHNTRYLDDVLQHYIHLLDGLKDRGCMYGELHQYCRSDLDGFERYGRTT